MTRNQFYAMLVLFIALLIFWALKHYGPLLGISKLGKYHGTMKYL